MSKISLRHMVRYAGASYSADAGISYYTMQYGELANVYADQACNYSYREFWF